MSAQPRNYGTSLEPNAPHEQRDGIDPIQTQKLLTARQVALILSVSTAWVYDHAERKRPHIPCLRLGKIVRFRQEDVQKFIEDMSR
jgi:excisionase family DNA binding protein